MCIGRGSPEGNSTTVKGKDQLNRKNKDLFRVQAEVETPEELAALWFVG